LDVAHLLAAAHIHPNILPVAQTVPLALVQPWDPLKAIQGSQLLGVDRIELALQHGPSVIAGHRHRKGAQVKQVKPGQLDRTDKTRSRQVPVVHHPPFEGAVDEHQLVLRLHGRIGVPS